LRTLENKNNLEYQSKGKLFLLAFHEEEPNYIEKVGRLKGEANPSDGRCCSTFKASTAEVFEIKVKNKHR